MWFSRTLCLYMLLALTLSSCNGCENQGPQPTSQEGNGPTICSATHAGFDKFETPTELSINDLKVGEGVEAVEGMTAHVHYIGKLQNGVQFDGSCERGSFSFVIGAKRVIAGWDKGVLGMKVGGVRRLFIPSDMAYGSREIANVIPANSPLGFDVELISLDGE